MTEAAADLTRNQALVYGALEKTGTPMSAYTILDELRDDGFRAPLQVYRALDKLVEQGLVHRLESLNAFVACRHASCHRGGFIAFAICDTCGQVSEFSDDALSRRLSGWAGKHSFKPSKTTIEIRGLCAGCSNA